MTRMDVITGEKFINRYGGNMDCFYQYRLLGQNREDIHAKRLLDKKFDSSKRLYSVTTNMLIVKKSLSITIPRGYRLQITVMKKMNNK